MSEVRPIQPEPPLSDEEQANKEAFDAYGMRLALWLMDRRVQPVATGSPVAGTWLLVDDPGVLVFTESEFTWLRDRNEPAGDYYRGTYSYMQGALTHDGFVISRDGADLYSLFQRYTVESDGGDPRAVHFYGVFMVQRRGDELHIRNQRTGGDLQARRSAFRPGAAEGL
ncbi:hypothetical protein [Propioniciclava tarda]|uniref:Uncharacterized protein n=1 Tax=Propioniciclava tarda TaxID=433330 RepID=A0A4Q9KLR5_PROTD|nr:hypothetical protein [Propioniciclava tarda]TBT95476.1 hypothetical protein ET996_05100 [Propioniciclava tarda]SMO49886.1 hypothetical protein SAMN06266982_10479 [Propioniciclava tarda]